MVTEEHGGPPVDLGRGVVLPGVECQASENVLVISGGDRPAVVTYDGDIVRELDKSGAAQWVVLPGGREAAAVYHSEKRIRIRTERLR